MINLCEVTLYFGDFMENELPATKENLEKYLKDELIISIFKDNQYYYLGLVNEINDACDAGTASTNVKVFMNRFERHVRENRKTFDNMFPNQKISAYSSVKNKFHIPADDIGFKYILLDVRFNPVTEKGLYKTLDDVLLALNVSYEVVEAQIVVARLLAGESLESILKNY